MDERNGADSSRAPDAGPVLSVLDLAPVGQGSTPAAALAQSVELARLAERRGYARVWVAEHHNMPGIASSSPPVLIAHLAASTSTIRVGAGGVMLPNHSSLVVAEQFGMLEALHPGRIDLGIGRAPGTDPVTAAALRRAPAALGADDFPEQLRDLFAYLRRHAPADHRGARARLPARGLDARLERLQRAGRRDPRHAVLVRAPLRVAQHRCARSRCTGTRSGRRPSSTGPTRCSACL